MKTEGKRVKRFIETFLRHNREDVYGSLIELRAFQSQILDEVFELDEDGLWKHRTAVIILPRKCGKSQLGAAIALYCLVTLPNGSEIYCAAAARDQARRVFDEAKGMVNQDADLAKALKLYRNEIRYDDKGSWFKVLSSDGKLQHGLNPSVAIIDETWAHENDELSEALDSGRVGRKQSMVIHITTPGIGEDSHLWELVDHGKKVKAGEIDDPTFYMYWNPPPDDCDHKEPEIWRKYHPALGDWVSEDSLKAQVVRWHENKFRRLHLAQWTAQRDAWLPHGAWAKCGDPLQEIEPRTSVVFGVDAAHSNDSTGLVLCTLDGRIKVLRHWEKTPQDSDEWRLPLKEVMEAIREEAKNYHVLEVAYDPYWFQLAAQELEEEGIPMAEFPCNSVLRMAPACASFYDSVMTHEITHDGNPALARHIGNARTRSDHRGTWITKESKSSKNKIDLAVCAVIAYERAKSYRERPNTRFAF